MRTHVIVAVVLSFAVAACGGSANDATVASVQLQTTNGNPRVGETSHVGATPVDVHGIAVPGVTCGFVSSAPAVATLAIDTGAVTAISIGVATITATCGGKEATVDITVRPNTMRLTITKAGNGGGAVFASPAGTPDYDAGTSITITATANPGSAFVAWGGACAGSAATAPCTLVMDADKAVTATFGLSQTFVSGTWSKALGTVTDVIGCQYAISASGVLTMGVVENADGTVSGTSSTTAHIGIVTTYSPSYTTCTALPFDVTATGNIAGTDASLTATLASSNGNFTMTFTGARNASVITGTA